MFNETELRVQMLRKGITIKELASKLGMNEVTFYRKMKDDGAFSRNQINEMIQILDITDPMGIFFAEELA